MHEHNSSSLARCCCLLSSSSSWSWSSSSSLLLLFYRHQIAPRTERKCYARGTRSLYSRAPNAEIEPHEKNNGGVNPQRPRAKGDHYPPPLSNTGPLTYKQHEPTIQVGSTTPFFSSLWSVIYRTQKKIERGRRGNHHGHFRPFPPPAGCHFLDFVPQELQCKTGKRGEQPRHTHIYGTQQPLKHCRVHQ